MTDQTTRPECNQPGLCRIMLLSSATTLGHYPSITDGYGNELNQDRNVTTQSYRCQTCGKEWSERYQSDRL